MKMKMALLLVFLLCFYLAPNLFSQARIIERTTDQFGNEVVVVRDSLTGVAERVWYSNPNLGMFPELGQTGRTLRGADISQKLLQEYAPRVLKSYQELLGVNPQEFRLVQAEGDGAFCTRMCRYSMAGSALLLTRMVISFPSVRTAIRESNCHQTRL
ncbi:hypothetical protein GWO09_21180 [candidate division KSB1 bacterium]|nr:hypothetical protein [candidate division KSB1 bacterium]